MGSTDRDTMKITVINFILISLECKTFCVVLIVCLCSKCHVCTQIHEKAHEIVLKTALLQQLKGWNKKADCRLK